MAAQRPTTRSEAAVIAIICFAAGAWVLFRGSLPMAAIATATGLIFAMEAHSPALFSANGGSFLRRFLRDGVLAFFHVMVALVVWPLALAPWSYSPSEWGHVPVWTLRVIGGSVALVSASLAVFFVFRFVRTALRQGR